MVAFVILLTEKNAETMKDSLTKEEISCINKSGNILYFSKIAPGGLYAFDCESQTSTPIFLPVNGFDLLSVNGICGKKTDNLCFSFDDYEKSVIYKIENGTVAKSLEIPNNYDKPDDWDFGLNRINHLEYFKSGLLFMLNTRNPYADEEREFSLCFTDFNGKYEILVDRISAYDVFGDIICFSDYPSSNTVYMLKNGKTETINLPDELNGFDFECFADENTLIFIRDKEIMKYEPGTEKADLLLKSKHTLKSGNTKLLSDKYIIVNAAPDAIDRTSLDYMSFYAYLYNTENGKRKPLSEDYEIGVWSISSIMTGEN